MKRILVFLLLVSALFFGLASLSASSSAPTQQQAGFFDDVKRHGPSAGVAHLAGFFDDVRRVPSAQAAVASFDGANGGFAPPECNASRFLWQAYDIYGNHYVCWYFSSAGRYGWLKI